MTLDTRMYVLDEVDADELFHVAQVLIVPPGRIGTCKITETETEVGNTLGQGFCAWLIVHRNREGSPLRPTTQPCCTMEERCDEETREGKEFCAPEAYPACFAEVMLDTAYGYRGPDEGDPTSASSCGELHAKILYKLGRWLDERGVKWEWRNEFDGKVYGGEDRYERLIDLAGNGKEAQVWFENTVLPVIESMESQT